MILYCVYIVFSYIMKIQRDIKEVLKMNKNNVILTTVDNQVLNQFKQSIDTTSKATADSYTNAVKQYMEYVEKYDMNPQKEETVKEYKRHMLGLGYKTSTVNNYLMAVKRFYAFLEEAGTCENIAKKVKKVHETKDFKKDCLTVQQAKTVLCTIDTKTLTGKRDYALMCLLLYTGLRTVEVARAQVKDIRNKGNATVLFVQGKGHVEKDSFVILPERVQEAINEYLKARKGVTDESPLFECTGNRASGKPLHVKSISRIVKGIFKDNGLVSDRLTAHSTRHTACTLALLSGASLQDVQQMARHQNINTTLIYSHNINRLSNNAESKIADLLG